MKKKKKKRRRRWNGAATRMAFTFESESIRYLLSINHRAVLRHSTGSLLDFICENLEEFFISQTAVDEFL